MSFYNSYNLRLDAFKVLLAALAGRVIDGMAGAEVTGVKVAEELAEELAVAMPARRRESEVSVNCIL